jgi:hypothetical protein
MNASLNLDRDSAKEPINELVLCIIKDAIKLGADGILLELDLELHSKFEKESKPIREKYRRPNFYEAIFKRRFKDYFCFGKPTIEKMFFELGQLPNALRVTYIINGVEKNMPSANGGLFGDITEILLVAAGVPPKTSGEISGVIETIKPTSKWIIESKDLTQRIALRKIRVA